MLQGLAVLATGTGLKPQVQWYLQQVLVLATKYLIAKRIILLLCKGLNA